MQHRSKSTRTRAWNRTQQVVSSLRLESFRQRNGQSEKKETLQQCSKRFYILKWNFLLPVESGRFHVQKCNQPTALPPAGCFLLCMYLQLIVVAAAALPTTLVNRLLPARRVSQSVPLQRFSRIFTYRVALRCFFQAPLSFPSLPLSPFHLCWILLFHLGSTHQRMTTHN